MKSSIFAGTVAAFAIAATASASPFLGLSVVEIADNGIDGYTTHRVYANLETGARVDAVFGNEDNTLRIATGDDSAFWQSPYGGATSQNINPAFIPIFPSLAYDSIVTIGLLTNAGNALNDIGIDFSGFEAGGSLETNNGSWFVTPDDAQGQEVGGDVLIGQFTIADGASLVGQVSIQGKDASGETYKVYSVTWVPAPGALALLGVAGLAGRRRRR